MSAAASRAPTGENLTALLLKDRCFCLNEAPAHPWKNLVAGGGAALSLVSDADEQLLLHLALNATVKLTAISFGLPGNDSCPRSIKLWTNQHSMGFGDVDAKAATQTFEITDATQTEFIYHVQPVKWQRTDSITIFIEDNHGSQVSSLTSVSIYGITTAGTDVSAIKKC